MVGILLFLHILGATIWTGGHIVLSTVILPRVLREGSPRLLLEFEKPFERIGLPALLVQVLTGIELARRYLPMNQWFDFSNPLAHGIVTKLLLLALTLGFALHAQFRVLPRLDEGRLKQMAWHILPVTFFSILFLIAGVAFRAGWYY